MQAQEKDDLLIVFIEQETQFCFFQSSISISI